ncbi:MAG: hypothetical protein DYG92_03630 [Leptolyngbya sp. PLA1]|nr:hypothetical protein [Leptolyngbya sp. PLA1]
MLAPISNACVWQAPPLSVERRVEPVCVAGDVGCRERGVIPYWQYLEKQNRRSERVPPQAEAFRPYEPPARAAMLASEWAKVGLRLDVRG